MAAVTHVHLAVAQALEARPAFLAASAAARRDVRRTARGAARRMARGAARRILARLPAGAGPPAALAIRVLQTRIMALALVT